MQSIQALRERHAALAKETRELVENNNDKWNADYQAKYDQGMAELDDIKAQVERIEKVLATAADSKIEEKIEESKERQMRNAGKEMFAKWLKGGDKALSAQDWADVRATMSTTTTTEGGYTVPVDVAGQISDVLKAYGGVRSVANVIQSNMGNDINFPTSDGTSEVGELIGQNTTATAADPSFGVVTLSTYKFSSKIVAVPFELLQDSAADVEAFVARRLGDRLGRITNQYFTTGTGTSQPKGVVTASAAGKTGTTGQTTSVIVDDLIDLVHSVDPAYRAGNCKFMMNDASLKVIRKLKDSQNRPVFLPGYEGLGGAMGDSLLGYDVVINQDVATMAANAKSILFGDFSRYTIRDVMGFTLFRFDDSAYAKLGQVGFLAWMRTGGTLTDGGSPLRYYANSST
jgi:HK97 family phage major capsid protein